MSRLDAMYLFVRVAELGSFAAVAQQQGVDRSVVTRQIAALEKHLGVRLIVRSTRRQALTSAGKLYLERCRAIIDLVETAETEVMEERLTPKGVIRMSLPISFGVTCLTPLLMRFAHDFPDVSLQLDYSDKLVNLIEEGYDLSIRVSDPSSTDIVRKLADCKSLIVGSEAYFQQKGRPQHPSELSQHVCLQYQNASRWSFVVDGELAHYPTSGRVQANNGDALAIAAVNGLGLARLPDFIAHGYIQSGQLNSVLDDYARNQDIGIYAVLPTNHYIPQRIRLLMEYLSKHLPLVLDDISASLMRKA